MDFTADAFLKRSVDFEDAARWFPVVVVEAADDQDRTVIGPNAIRPEIVRHLADYVKPGSDALVFTEERGNAVRRPNFNQRGEVDQDRGRDGSDRPALP